MVNVSAITSMILGNEDYEHYFFGWVIRISEF